MSNKEVSVLGLGSMGIAIARLYLDQGYKVTVWNRTAEKADALRAKGAVLARSAAEAVRAARTAVMCVYDYRAADAIFALDGVAAAMDGRLLVQLTTGSPRDALAAEAWAHRHGAAYLEGAIHSSGASMRPTMGGWNEIESLTRPKVDSSQAFVAMWFHSSTEDVYANGIAPAIVATGHKPLCPASFVMPESVTVQLAVPEVMAMPVSPESTRVAMV